MIKQPPAPLNQRFAWALYQGGVTPDSTGTPTQQIAFAQQPDWKRFANLKTEYGPPSNFWQPKLPPQLKQLSS